MPDTPTRYRVDFDYLATLLLPSLLRNQNFLLKNRSFSACFRLVG